MIQQAIILAAGNGSRMRSDGKGPKPLRKVAGLSLIKRSILNAKRAGVREVVIVVGYRAEEIMAELEKDSQIDIPLRFVKTPDWKKSNGVSLLSAKPLVKGPFLLLMADHIFDLAALTKMVEQGSRHELVLGIDRDWKSVFDLEDATKVQVEEGNIIEIGKELPEFNSLDTGVFVCHPSFFEALETVFFTKGDVSISEGVREMIKKDQAGYCDLSGLFWQDVDTPQALSYAEEHLFKNLRKPTDGWISKNINRRISIPITRMLVRTGISANHITGIVTLIGILSGFFVSKGDYWNGTIGAILFKLASILDGCDGELSKLKMTSSKRGEWLDTLGDNLTYVVFIIGVMISVCRTHSSLFYVFESIFASVGLALTLSFLFFYLIRYTSSGSLVTIQKEMGEEEKSKQVKGIMKWVSKVRFMIKRDFFALFFLFLAMAGKLDWILHLTCVAVHVAWISVLMFRKDLLKVQTTPQAVQNRPLA